MTDELEAIRARHVAESEAFGGWRDFCSYDGDGWPCDTAQVLASLDAAEARRWHHNPDAPSEHFCEDCDAAIEREKALREALEALAGVQYTLRVGKHDVECSNVNISSDADCDCGADRAFRLVGAALAEPEGGA